MYNDLQGPVAQRRRQSLLVKEDGDQLIHVGGCPRKVNIEY